MSPSLPVALAHTLQIPISSPNNPILHCLLNYSHSSEGGTFVRRRFDSDFSKKWLWNLSSKSTRTLTSPYRTCRTASSSPNRLHRLDRASRSATTFWTSLSSPPPVSSTVRFSRTTPIPSFRFVLVTYRSQSFILIRARCSATKRCRFDSLNIEKMNKSAFLSLIKVEIFSNN